MKGKIMVFVAAALLLMPLMTFVNKTSADEEKCTMEIYDVFGNKIEEREVSASLLRSLEERLARGDESVIKDMGVKWDFGFSNWIISYGKGKVYIPLSRERSFLRFLLRPIFFEYQKGFTLVKFGANYAWKGKSVGDYGMMLRNQAGVMVGFVGLHIRIRHPLEPDTHLFIGTTLLLAGRDKIL